MSRTRVSKVGQHKNEEKKKEKKDWPVVVYIWAFGLFIATWLIVGEAVFQNKPHPFHWLAGLGGGIVGIGVGWLWYRWRGDIF